jgi:predicted alpha/beta hydrolase
MSGAHGARRDVGTRRIGHFGFFRRRNAERLWPPASAWFDRFAH